MQLNKPEPCKTCGSLFVPPWIIQTADEKYQCKECYEKEIRKDRNPADTRNAVK
jgi:DNA-directed RNA polymerase subunit RPC12/RpoP